MKQSLVGAAECRECFIEDIDKQGRTRTVRVTPGEAIINGWQPNRQAQMKMKDYNIIYQVVRYMAPATDTLAEWRRVCGENLDLVTEDFNQVSTMTEYDEWTSRVGAPFPFRICIWRGIDNIYSGRGQGNVFMRPTEEDEQYNYWREIADFR